MNGAEVPTSVGVSVGVGVNAHVDATGRIRDVSGKEYLTRREDNENGRGPLEILEKTLR